MSPTLLEGTIALVAAVLVFLAAVRAVPLIIEALSHYFDRTLNDDPTYEKEAHQYERKR